MSNSREGLYEQKKRQTQFSSSDLDGNGLSLAILLNMSTNIDTLFWVSDKMFPQILFNLISFDDSTGA